VSKPKVAIIDNAVYPELYKPVEHWSRYLRDVEWTAFYATGGGLPRPQDFSHFILTGSEASILNREPWVEREVDFVREAFRLDRPLLGSCYGHQLLALALAGPRHVGRCREPEIGWIPIEITADSPLLGPKGTAYTFSIHFDEVRDLEDPFLVLASSPVCPIQAFGMKDHPVWGLQIHPEIDVEAARGLLRDFGGVFPDVLSLYRKALDSSPRDSGLIFKIIDGFLRFSS
jgi:GMP synthase-like glutamine amidotransferase